MGFVNTAMNIGVTKKEGVCRLAEQPSASTEEAHPLYFVS
jgi:hypothetical protein